MDVKSGTLAVVRPKGLPFCPAIILTNSDFPARKIKPNEVVVRLLGSHFVLPVQASAVFQYTEQVDEYLEKIAKTRLAKNALAEARRCLNG